MAATDFKAEPRSFGELMSRDNRNIYVIPLYQRGYVWSAENVRRLWDDIVDCILEEGSKHFLGSVVLTKSTENSARPVLRILEDNSYDLYSVVDGQQRLTTLCLVLAAVKKDMGVMGKSFQALAEESPQSDRIKERYNKLISSEMGDRLLTEIDDPDSPSSYDTIPRLIVDDKTYGSFRAMVNSGSDDRRKRKIEKAFLFLLDRVAEYREDCLPCETVDDAYLFSDSVSAQDVLDYYSSLISTLLNRMLFVRIECGQEEDVFQVFESLNGTGVSLSFVDRIKSMIMGRGTSEGAGLTEDQINGRWSEIQKYVSGAQGDSDKVTKAMEDFINCVLFVKTGKRVSKKSATDEFKRTFLSSHKSVVKALEELKSSAQIYGNITNNRLPITAKAQGSLPLVIRGILVNNPKQSMVPLLAAALKYGFDDYEGVSDEFALIAHELLTLFVRHRVCEKRSNLVDGYSGKILKAMEEDSVDEVVDVIRQCETSDEEFRRSFADLALNTSNQSEQDRARYYLLSLENYLRKRNGDGVLSDAEEYTIEHIIPQKVNVASWIASSPSLKADLENDPIGFDDLFKNWWIPSIGNMCLLRRHENSLANNRNFKKKIELYQRPVSDGRTAAGTFELVRQLVDNNYSLIGDDDPAVLDDGVFGRDSVEKRAKRMADWAVEVWK